MRRFLPLLVWFFALGLLALGPAYAEDGVLPTADGVRPYPTLIGGEIVYTVEEGDSLTLIGAKLGLDWGRIARINGLDARKPIHPGQKLRANNLKIAPESDDLPDGDYILINIPDRTLYYFRNRVLRMAFPVGLGMLHKGKGRWRTPLGKFKITIKDKDPVWYVPPSIQKEMAEEGEEVKEVVPSGPENPLGRFALQTTFRNILIHETIFPASVYQFQSHGCIRVLPRDMGGFFKGVETGTPGELIYKNVKLAVTPEGKVFLEVHKDVYGRIKDTEALARGMIEERGLHEAVDWDKVGLELKEKSGVAEDVTK